MRSEKNYCCFALRYLMNSESLVKSVRPVKSEKLRKSENYRIHQKISERLSFEKSVIFQIHCCLQKIHFQ